jgi:hypothetical protein
VKDLTGSVADVRLPVHECVERPILPCPACQKWAGDPFATVRDNPESFPGVAGLLPESSGSQNR